MFEKPSAVTIQDDPDRQRDHDSKPGWDSHQQQAALTAAQEVMSSWTGAFYDYAEQLLKAQRQFAHRLLGAGAPLRHVAQDAMSSNAGEHRSSQRETSSNQPHESSTESRKNEQFNDDTARYNKRFDNDTSGGSAQTPAAPGARTPTPTRSAKP